jgi:hypothetical protein
VTARERKKVRGLLAKYGIQHPRRARPLDPTEEVILVEGSRLACIDEQEVVRRLMAALPHRKVALVADEGLWRDGAEDV